MSTLFFGVQMDMAQSWKRKGNNYLRVSFFMLSLLMMKEKQILTSTVSNLEFVQVNEQEGNFAFWDVTFTHEGKEKQGELFACIDYPEKNHHHIIALY